MVGTGLQLIICAFFLIIFAAIGFLSPANRGSIMIGKYIRFDEQGWEDWTCSQCASFPSPLSPPHHLSLPPSLSHTNILTLPLSHTLSFPSSLPLTHSLTQSHTFSLSLSPSGMLFLFVLMGAFAGFASARLYKTFKGNFHIPSIVCLFLLFGLLSSLIEVVILGQYFK